ncbi:Rft protein-domain-containing protein [Bombardia bombarda]|uniref:Man(5)GlcNAc(2)-PP-dolichol translocation protein RFT1 n=1 Tax=Bombardia bombarda TaxID=252184 RepID=A0AA39WH35_9PEZI|nr:Rft protein-domain-containing protein [Bombardia bombarda]
MTVRKGGGRASGAGSDDVSSTGAVQGASLLVLNQIVARAVTFVANQVLLRFMTAQLLGVSTQLEVYYLSVIFFARESLRVAIQRQDSSSTTRNGSTTGSPTQAVVNLGYLSILLGLPLASIFGWMYLHSLSAATLASAPYLVPSLYLYALAAVVELLSEPAFVVMQARLQTKTRAAAEFIATFLRCAVTLGTAALWSGSSGRLGVLPFALGQLSYGLGLLAVYAWYGAGLATREGFSLLPRRIATSTTTTTTSKKDEKSVPKKDESSSFALSYFYRPTLQLASSMMAQNVVKHLLTQGDTFLVTALSDPTAQGVYALANNYGGLVARVILQPIEESSRNHFSKMLARPHRPKIPNPLLKSYLLLSLLITSLGPAAAPHLLSLAAGPRWAASPAGACLAAYMYYIPLLAVNGISEAFVVSVASEADLHRQSAWMTAFSLVFASAGFVFLRVLDMGAVGLVIANGINMGCRIVWCWVFIRGWFKDRGMRFGIQEVMPGPLGVAAGVVASGAVGRLVGRSTGEMGVRGAFVELVKVAGVAVPLVLVLAFSEREFLYSQYQSYIGRRQKSL